MAASQKASPSGSIARSERAALCDLFEERGPLAPTLCEGWTASDLAAHLYVRESRPWEAIGVLVPALSSVTDRAMDRVKGSMGFDGLVAKIRSGPGALVKPFDAQMNTIEYFVHHEDVRRAGTGAGAGTRVDPALDAALFTALRRSAKLLARKVKGVGLELTAPGHGTITARTGSPVVTITGSPQELVLYLFGRTSVAEVTFDGPDDAVATVKAVSFGL